MKIKRWVKRYRSAIALFSGFIVGNAIAFMRVDEVGWAKLFWMLFTGLIIGLWFGLLFGEWKREEKR